MGWNPLIWVAGGLVLLRFVFSVREILGLLVRWWRAAEDKLYAHQCYKIPMYNDCLQENPLYRKAVTYIGSLPSLEESNNVLLFSKKPNIRSDLYIQMDANQTVRDTFLGARITWTDHAGEALVLRVRKRDRRRILRPYIQHIEAVADEVELRKKEVRLFTNSIVAGDDGREVRRRWKSVPFTHPSTMETLAMDPDLKNRVKTDLENFLKNKMYYHRLGRVWKRSYLLYGPPGTGKSSFIAAMAKFLSFDIYDVDLGRVSDESELKTLLVQTSPRSVIVVEDLDHYLHNRANSLTGVLNFMDGIFSCCGEERVMVFTMRDAAVSGIDSAVMRPGRLDVHLFFPLCNFTAFKTMASSYLGLKDHKLYPAVEEIFQNGASISQAEIGEIMIANRGSPSRALKTLLNALQQSSAARRVGGLLGNITTKKKTFTENSIVAPGSGREDMEPRTSEMEGALSSNGMLSKEFRKLYGLIRVRSGIRKEGHSSAMATPTNAPSPLPRHRQQLSTSSSDLPPQPSSDNCKSSPSPS